MFYLGLNFVPYVFVAQALVKRSPSSGMSSTMKESSAFQSELRMPESAIRHQSTSPADKGKVTICDGRSSDEEKPKKSSVCKNIEGCREELLAQVVRVFACKKGEKKALKIQVD